MSYQHNHPFAFAHMVYFSLVDRSIDTQQRFLQACLKYLSNHSGMKHFSLGIRDVEMQREVNARDFDISMNMVFDSKAHYELYAKHPCHEEFITVTAGMSHARRVFDSYIQTEAPIAACELAASETATTVTDQA